MFDIFEQFDSAFDPDSAARPLSTDAIPDGSYQAVIANAVIETSKAGERFVRMVLKINRAVDLEYVGKLFEKLYFFRDQAAVDRFGQDLVLLGIPAHTWTAKNGKRFSVEMPAALPSLIGRLAKVVKRTVTNSTTGKVSHYIDIVGVISASMAVEPPMDPDTTPF